MWCVQWLADGECSGITFRVVFLFMILCGLKLPLNDKVQHGGPHPREPDGKGFEGGDARVPISPAVLSVCTDTPPFPFPAVCGVVSACTRGAWSAAFSEAVNGAVSSSDFDAGKD
jgi:hypothetical protein